jgi:hypothetical protein
MHAMINDSRWGQLSIFRRMPTLVALTVVIASLSSFGLASSPLVAHAEACEWAANISFAAKEAKNLKIENCNPLVRVDIISVSDTNEGEFKLGKKCEGVNLEVEGSGAGSECNEQVTFTGACTCPHMTATFELEYNPGGNKKKSKLEGC